jgi:hypothetical protein
MVIDEDKLLKVVNMAQGSAGVIKSYLSSLGQFIGNLTVS